MSMIAEQKWNGWQSLVLRHDGFRLMVPLEFGPRILFFGCDDGENLFQVFQDEEGAGSDGNYFFRGGHRLWHAPEHPERTYQPDNEPVQWETVSENAFRVTAPVEKGTGIRKELTVSVEKDGTFCVRHRLANEGLWAVGLAAWALTVLRPGGVAFIPLPEKGEHPRDLLPEFHLVPWTYTDFSLPAWKFRRRFLSLDARKTDRPQKAGSSAGGSDWLAYWRDGMVFVKWAQTFTNMTYPDRGCALEVFSNGEMAELETLGPQVDLAPGDSVEHTEEWMVVADVPEPANDTAWEEHVLSRVTAWRERRSSR